MISRRFLYLIIIIALPTITASAQSSDSISSQNISSIVSPAYLHGMGISKYSRYDPQRSFADAHKKAIEDLTSNLMTSVYLEFYGTSSISTQLQSEFAIDYSGINIDKVVVIDSLLVADNTIYMVRYKNTESMPSSILEAQKLTDWKNELFSPVKIHGYWISAGIAEVNSFDIYRSWVQAKQDALVNLSTHLQTVVQASSKVLNEELSTINYTTSKHIFKNINILKRQFDEKNIFILIAVKENDIHKLE